MRSRGNGLPDGCLEGDFRTDVVLAACRTGRVVAWRQNAGVALLRTGGAIRVGEAGVSDIVGVANDGSGRLVAFEVKSVTAILTTKQASFLRRMRQLGAVAALYRYEPTRSWDENVAAAVGALLVEIDAARLRAATRPTTTSEDTTHGDARTHVRSARQPRKGPAQARRRAVAAGL